MSSSAADRVILVWPSGQHSHHKLVLGRKLDLLLLHRHASSLRAHLAVVTQDDLIADNAAELGIPVFDSVKDSHLFLWNSRRSPRPDFRPKVRELPSTQDARRLLGRTYPYWYQTNIWRYVSGSLITVPALLVIGMLLVLTLPEAHITLTPVVYEVTAQLEIIGDPDLDELTFSSSSIPAQIKEVEIIGRGETATTGSVDLATQHAQGFVVFTNLIDQDVKLPAGTAVRTTSSVPIRFVTQQDVNLESRNSSAIAPVRAYKPGPTGNIGLGLINDIEGPLGVSVAVTNQDPITGGDVVRVPSVARADRNRLFDMVREQIRQQGHDEIVSQLNLHDFSPITAARVTDVTSSTFSSFIGDQTDMLTVEIRATVAATVIDETLAYEIVREDLAHRAGTNFAILDNTITFTRSTEPIRSIGYQVPFTLDAQADAIPVIDLIDVQKAVRWKPHSQALDILYENFPLVSRPTVKSWPSWFAYMPWLSWRTQVSLNTDTNPTGTRFENSGS